MNSVFAGNITNDYELYTNITQMAKSIAGELQGIWISTLVFGGTLVVLALYLILKSFKVQQRSFFVLTGLIAIIGAVTAALFIYYARQIDIKISNFNTEEKYFIEMGACFKFDRNTTFCN